MVVLSLEEFDFENDKSIQNQESSFLDDNNKYGIGKDFTHEDYLNQTRKRAFHVIKEQSLYISKKALVMKEDILVTGSYVEVFDGLFEVEITMQPDGYAQIKTGGFFYSERNKVTKSKRIKIYDIDFAVNKLAVYFQDLAMKEIDASCLSSVLDTIETLLDPQGHIFQ